MSKSKTLRGGSPILRGNVTFLALKEIGELGDNGKAVVKLGYGQRMTAQPDMPLTLVEAVLRQLLPHCRYSSPAAAKKDLEAFKKSVMRLEAS